MFSLVNYVTIVKIVVFLEMKIISNKKIITCILSVIFISFFFSKIVFAVWDGLPYNPGETNNPECLPSQTDCDVLPAVTTELDPVFTTWLTNTPPLYSYTETDPAFTAWNKSTGISITKSQISDFPAIPNTLASLADDSTHRLVTDTEKSIWNGKQDALGFIPVSNATTVNGHALSGNISVTATDVGLGNVPNLSFSGSNTGDETTSSIQTKLGTVSTSTSGYLTSTDWNTFNNKQPSGSYLTSFTELDPAFTTWLTTTPPLYSYTETDPIFTTWNKSTGISITESQISDLQHYLTSYTETDPIFIASQAHNITSTDITNLSNLSGTNSGDNAINSLYSGLVTSKQDALNGTGFVKISGTSVSYDNSTYLTAVPAGYLQNNIGIAGGTTLIGGTTSSETLILKGNSVTTEKTTLYENGDVVIGLPPGGTHYYKFEVHGRTVPQNMFVLDPDSRTLRMFYGGFFDNTLTFGNGTLAYNGKLTVNDFLTGGDLRSNSGHLIAASPIGTANYVSWVESGLAWRGILGFNANSPDLVYRQGAQSFADGTELFRIKSNGNVGIGTTAPSSALEIGSGGSFKLSGGASSGQGNIQLGAAANAGYDTNLVYLNSTANTGGFMFGSTAAFTAGNGPYFGGRGNTYSSIATQRGNLFMSAGNPSTPAGSEGIMRFLSGADLTRMVIGNSGQMGLGGSITNTGTLAGASLVIDTSGNVGIGTTSPSYILSLGGTSARTFGMNRNTTAGTAGLGLTITSGGAIAGTADLVGGDLTLSSGIATGTGTSAIHFLTTTAGASATTDRTPTEKVTILGNGNVGISNNAPGFLLHVGSASTTTGTTVARFENGGGTCDIVPSTSGGVTCSSDMNLKKNINTLDGIAWTQTQLSTQPITNLDKILALVPVTYNWKTEQDTDAKHTGFIAQDIQQLFPDLVSTDPTTNLLSLNYSGMIPYTIKAIEEMNLKLLDINNFDKPNDWRDSLIAWFSNAENHITRIFTGEVCLKDEGQDPVCINSTELKSLKALLNGNSANTNNTPVIPTCSDGIKNQDETDIDIGGVCASKESEVVPPSEPVIIVPTEIIQTPDTKPVPEIVPTTESTSEPVVTTESTTL